MWVLVGLVLGIWFSLDNHLDASLGGTLGVLIGGIVQWRLWSARRPAADTAQRLARLESEVAALRQQVARLANSPTPLPAAAAESAELADSVSAAAAEPVVHARRDARPTDPPNLTAPPPAGDAGAPPQEPPPVRAVPPTVASREPAGESLDALYARAREWLLGGNTVMRVGLLVLFFGFAFLARYAVEHALLPLELRMAAIAIGGVALLTVGWRLRGKRSGYALSMQGGGVAVLYLTVFAALRLYQMLPAGFAFVLLLAVVALSALLAILQNAPALAVIGTAGGFMAPILASTGQGDHVSLFGYYALLNAGVLLIAWKKAWRLLNLVGFAFTFSISLAWGARDYRPEFFASTEPFLVLFFLMYVAAAVLYAWRQAPRLAHYVDGGLVFGTPVVGFGLQAALVQGYEFGLAWSALAVGGFYLLLARWLLSRARESLRLLVESFLALGVAFLTLAIPLALDGRWTAAAWALEGAALLWVGARQSRRLAMAAGLLLQLGAGLFFLDELGVSARKWPLANSQYLGALLIALAGFFAARIADQHRQAWPRLLRPAAVVLLVWATLWWLAGGLTEIDAALSRRSTVAAALIFFSASGALAAAVARRLAWPALHGVALINLAGMLLSLLGSLEIGETPAWGMGLAAWAFAAAAHLWSLRQADEVLPRSAGLAHATGLWLLTAAAAWMLADAAHARLPGDSWTIAASALAPIGALLALLWADRHVRWPVSIWPAAYLQLGAGVLAGLLCLWVLFANFAGDGDAVPLPYLPLLNPLELVLAGALLTVLRWWQALMQDEDAPAPAGLTRLPVLLAALAFLVANGMLLRALHHYAAVPWDGGEMFRSDTVQMALSLFWASLGLALTFVASRQARRGVWMVGAALLAVVVAKLFLVDMASTGTVARIVSFLGAGVLLLVVGYFSPLPPAREAQT